MARNFIQDGDVLNHTAAAALISGQALLLGVRLGVALTDAAIGDTIAVAVKGVFDLPKLSTDNVAQGAALYWDDTNKRLTVTATANTLAGYAAAASGAGVATVNISLNA